MPLGGGEGVGAKPVATNAFCFSRFAELVSTRHTTFNSLLRVASKSQKERTTVSDGPYLFHS